jgi:hypothetical protein
MSRPGKETQLARAVVVHMWLWWATFTVRRQTGSGTVASFKAAQAATARLYA